MVTKANPRERPVDPSAKGAEKKKSGGTGRYGEQGGIEHGKEEVEGAT